MVSVCVQLLLLPLCYLFPPTLIFLTGPEIVVSVTMAGNLDSRDHRSMLAQISSVLAAPFVSAANALNWVMVHSVDVFSALV